MLTLTEPIFVLCTFVNTPLEPPDDFLCSYPSGHKLCMRAETKALLRVITVLIN